MGEDDLEKLHNKILMMDIFNNDVEPEEEKVIENLVKPKKKYDNNKWNRENPEKFKEVHKKNLEKYRKNHRDKMNEIGKKYYYKHREEILAKAKERYKKKKEENK